MPQFKLPSTGGVTHLPQPTGKYTVGYVDIFTPSQNDSMSGLLLRLYYPSTAPTNCSTDYVSHWARWFPLPQYANGYLRYNFSSLGPLIPLLGHLFIWLSGDPRFPAAEGAPYLRDDKRRPVVVFSHGLAACRTSYSFLCTDLASNGYCVAVLEHGDGSACLRAVKEQKDAQITFKYQDLLEPGMSEYEIRNKQVKYRASEASFALNVLEEINIGNLDNAWIQNMSEGEVNTFRTDLKDSMNIDMVVMSGHSMGGATTVLSLATDTRFKIGVALDSWMFPLREEKLNYSSPGNLLFVNCEKFQETENLEVMRRLTSYIRPPSHHACRGSYLGLELLNLTTGRLLSFLLLTGFSTHIFSGYSKPFPQPPLAWS